MRIIIRNMFCPICKYLVKLELEELGLQYTRIDLGEVEFAKDLTAEQMQLFDHSIRKYGLEVMPDDRNKLVRRTKGVIKDLLENPELEKNAEFKVYLSQKLKYDYVYINKVFLEETGNSIEKYYISRKIVKAIELLVHYNLSFTEIAYQLNFESEEHLKYQFLIETGLTPLHFVKLKEEAEVALEKN